MDSPPTTANNDDTKNTVEGLLRQYFAQTINAQKIHEKCSDNLFCWWSCIQITQIFISVVITGGFATIFFRFHTTGAASIGAIMSLILLLLNTYIKNYNLSVIAQQHKHAATEMWLVAAKFTSLILDTKISTKSIEALQKERDTLIEKMYSIYSGAPNIPFKKYNEFLIKLKNNKIIYTDEEINSLLPNELRTNKSQMNKT